jgi:phytoene desaturase
MESGSYLNFLAYLKVAEKHYHFSMEQLILKNLDHPADYFNAKNLYHIVKYNALQNHYRHISKFFKHPNLKTAFTFQDSYLSLSPFHSPALYSMFAYSELTEGNFLPQGGMYQIIVALTQIARKYRIKIYYKSPVKKINLVKDQATGVTLENNSEKNADLVVVNSDLSYAYRKLLSDTVSTNRLLHKKYSCSIIVFHWGLDKVYPQLQTHNLFFGQDYRQGFEQVLNQPEPPLQPHFYVQAPTRTDATRAPKNCDTISVLVPINHLNPLYPQDWDAYKNKLRAYIIRKLEGIGIHNLEKQIKFEISSTPQDWQNKLNLTYGAVYSLNHNLRQMGIFREKRRSKKYKNVYFVGASTHPGSGLPTVLLSSQYTSRKILLAQ